MTKGLTALAAVALSSACAQGDGNGTAGVATFAAPTVGNDTQGPMDTSGGDDGPALTTDSGSAPDTTADTGSTGGIPHDPPDLSDGVWTFQNVSMTPGISLHARRATLPDGREVVGWAQSNPVSLGNVNIMSAQGPDDWVVTSVTAATDVQNTYPAMAGGGRALLAWAGQAEAGGDYDVYLVRSQGESWSGPENLSEMFEDPTAPLNDLEPVILRRTDGGVAVVYTATMPAGNGLPAGTPEIYVSKFFEDNKPSQRLSLHPSGANCNALAGATAPSDVFHVVLACADGGGAVLVHATDRSGEWDTTNLNGVTSGVLSPSMAAGTQGAHIVWIQNVACGVDSCSEVFHMATDAEEIFGTPVQVTDTANVNERMPAVGVDPWGRVLVLAQARVDNQARLYLSVAEDGETFGDPVRISPDSTDGYQTPDAFAFDQDGNPSFVFEYVVSGSDPLNIEIYVARFVPN